jgi:hypothetical protein
VAVSRKGIGGYGGDEEIKKEIIGFNVFRILPLISLSPPYPLSPIKSGYFN